MSYYPGFLHAKRFQNRKTRKRKTKKLSKVNVLKSLSVSFDVTWVLKKFSFFECLGFMAHLCHLQNQKKLESLPQHPGEDCLTQWKL